MSVHTVWIKLSGSIDKPFLMWFRYFYAAYLSLSGLSAFDFIMDYDEWIECGYFTDEIRARLKGTGNTEWRMGLTQWLSWA